VDNESKQVQQLRDAYLCMLAERDYRFRYDRIGAPAMEDAFDDPEHPPESVDLLEHFRTAVQNGVYPAPNLLIFVANCFGKYLEARGELSLDDVFNLHSKQKVGSPLQAREKRSEDDEILMAMALHRGANPKASIADAADAAIKRLGINDSTGNIGERMQRYYKRLWSKMEKQMEGKRIRLDSYIP